MEIGETAMWWPQSTLDYLGFVIGMLVLMYLGRHAAHGAIRALCAAFGDTCTRIASAVMNVFFLKTDRYIILGCRILVGDLRHGQNFYLGYQCVI